MTQPWMMGGGYHHPACVSSSTVFKFDIIYKILKMILHLNDYISYCSFYLHVLSVRNWTDTDMNTLLFFDRFKHRLTWPFLVRWSSLGSAVVLVLGLAVHWVCVRFRLTSRIVTVTPGWKENEFAEFAMYQRFASQGLGKPVNPQYANTWEPCITFQRRDESYNTLVFGDIFFLWEGRRGMAE